MKREQIAREVDFVDYFMQTHFDDYGEETHRAMQEAVNLIKQEPKIGRWIIDEYGIKHCSYCHAINNSVYSSYCPNCGAKNESEV